jgi:hypothetical protein
MADKTQRDPEETADGTSYREEAGGGDRDLGDADGTSYREEAGGGDRDFGDADGTSYREIAKEDDTDDERSSAD